jgi:sodium/hydrogen exchanger 8
MHGARLFTLALFLSNGHALFSAVWGDVVASAGAEARDDAQRRHGDEYTLLQRDVLHQQLGGRRARRLAESQDVGSPGAMLQDAEAKVLAPEKTMATKEGEEAYENEESKPDFAYVMGILGTAATWCVGHILDHEMGVSWIPEAAVGLMVGFLIAAFATEGWIGPLAFPWAHHMRFDFEFFMTFLLPPIIFEAGFNMNVKKFFANLGPTMFFAFAGTFLSTFVVGGLVWWAGQQGWCYPLGLLASLVFGSLISATDPVTVLAVFQALGVKVDLFSMVFGESVLNDAVAIVLSRTLLSFNAPDAQVDAASIFAAIVSFVVIFIGSALIGSAC